MHEVGVRLERPALAARARIVGESLARRRGAEEARKQIVQLGDGRSAAPEARATLPTPAEDVNEEARLPMLLGAR